MGIPSIHPLLGRDGWELGLVQGVEMHLSVLQLDLAGLEVGHGGVGVLHEVLVVAVGEIVPRVCASRFLAVDGRVDGLLGLH